MALTTMEACDTPGDEGLSHSSPVLRFGLVCNAGSRVSYFRCHETICGNYEVPLEEIPMHFALIPCLISAAVGGIAGWIVRDREFYKSKVESKAEPDADAGATGAMSDAAA